MNDTTAEGRRHLQRQLRLIGILDAAVSAGLAPVPLLQLHTIAYLADALAPVWDLRIVDAQLLKQREGPMSPVLQADVDALVGRGVVIPQSVRHVGQEDGGWRLDAEYSLNPAFSQRILRTAHGFDDHARHLAFVREVVLAVSGLGAFSVRRASAADAAYGDPVVDDGDLLDLSGTRTFPNRSAQVALRFGDLIRSELDLRSAEKIHLYIRALYHRMADAA